MSMIMADTQVAAGVGFGRTKQNGSAFFGTDALRACLGGIGDSVAGADSARVGEAVGNAGLAERTVDDGEVLRSVSGWGDSVGQAATKSIGGIGGRNGGVWRI